MINQNNLFISFDTIVPALKASNRNQVLKRLADIAATNTGLSGDMLFDALETQEQEAGSGIGDGIAMPHLCIKGLNKPYVLFAKLPRSVDFESVDDRPVDLVCMLLSPAEDGPYHLRRLARLSRLLRDRNLCQHLRDAQDEDTVHALINGTQPQVLAA